jgi:hypothetical protein
VKRTHLAVILIPLALALPSCGGDDSKKGSTQAAGTSAPAEAESPQSGSQDARSGTPGKQSAPTGSGGTSSADADRAAKQPDSSKKQGSGSGSPTAPRPNRKQAKKPKTPQEHLAALSPSERRRLHKDLYEQGKNFCYAYGPEQLAKEYKLTGSGAQTIAQQYARLYEAATPTLILPFQQGCLAGFRKHARNPPKELRTP